MNIAARHVRFIYGGRHRPPRTVFGDLTLDIGAGECVGVLGREGTGKTTLLNLLGGLLSPASGTIRCDGIDPHAGGASRSDVRLRTAFTFQFPEEQFLRPTVAEEFADVLRLRGVGAAEIPARTRASLALMGLDPVETLPRSPFSLSIGESRRLALALLDAVGPGAAFLDEPTAGLDAPGLGCALEAMAKLRRRGTTIVVATHDVNFLAEIAGRILLLGDGIIAADGAPEDILTDGPVLSRHGYAVPDVVAVAGELRKEGRLDDRRVLRLRDLSERLVPAVPHAPSEDSGESGEREK